MLVRAAGVVNTKKCWQESKTCVAVVLRKRTTRRACARVSYNTRTIVACSTTPPLRAPCPPLCGDVDYDTPLCDITYYPPPSPMYMLLSLSLSLSLSARSSSSSFLFFFFFVFLWRDNAAAVLFLLLALSLDARLLPARQQVSFPNSSSLLIRPRSHLPRLKRDVILHRLQEQS